MFIHYFFFNDTATTESYTLSLHDALPIRGRSLWLQGYPSRPQGLLGYPPSEREPCARHRHSTTTPPLCRISTSPRASPSVSSSASSSGLRATALRSSMGSSARASRPSCSSPPRGSVTHVRSGAD